MHAGAALPFGSLRSSSPRCSSSAALAQRAAAESSLPLPSGRVPMQRSPATWSRKIRSRVDLIAPLLPTRCRSRRGGRDAARHGREDRVTGPFTPHDRPPRWRALTATTTDADVI
eukprot:6073263-Prymnesium_polylepis.2